MVDLTLFVYFLYGHGIPRPACISHPFYIMLVMYRLYNYDVDHLIYLQGMEDLVARHVRMIAVVKASV